MSACLEWTSTFTNNWILHGCSLFKTRIANSSSWIFQSSPFLDSCFLILDPQVLILPYQNITTFRRRELSFKDRVKTVNLLLSRTVYRLSGKKEQLQLNVFRVSLLRWFLGVVYRVEVDTEGGVSFFSAPTLYSHLVVGSVQNVQQCCQRLYYLQNLIPLHLPRQSKQIQCTNLIVCSSTQTSFVNNSVECL